MSASASAIRGGYTAGVLEVEHAGGTVAVPPPPPPALSEGEFCFRSRAREFRLLLKDVKGTVLPNGESIPGERRWIKFRPHPSGLFGEYVTADPEEIFALRCATGELCLKHKGPLEDCEKRGLRCRPLEQAGEVWKADSQVEEYATSRAAQLVSELTSQPGLLEKVQEMGFTLEPVKRAGRREKPERAERPEEPPAGGLNV